MPSFALPNIVTSGLPFQFATIPPSGDTPAKLFLKNTQKAYVFDGTAVTEVTDADYPGWSTVSVTSITRVSSTATVTLSSAVNWRDNQQATIAGADQAEYNGTFTINMTSTTTFTYTVTGTPATPATGTITATSGITTVPGVVYLDGTIYVMDEQGKVYGSDILLPTDWDPLNLISADSEGDTGIALTRHLNYVIAFKERSTEILYNAGNAAPGSPLSRMTNAISEIGCAAAGSLAFTDNSVYFMSASFPRGRSVMRMVGFSPNKVSTPFVDRILNADDLAGVYAFTVKSNGHVFYVLTLTTSAITLVYDEITNEWHRWTFYTRNSPVSCTTSTDSDGLTTITKASHGLSDGDPIDLLGDMVYITYLTANTFTVRSLQTVPTSTQYTSWTSSNFPPCYATRGTNQDLLLTVTGAKVFNLTPSEYQDDSAPIDCRARTMPEDWGGLMRKMVRRLELVGDKLDSSVLVRYTDDDYQTWSEFRPIEIDDDRAQLRMLGSTRRRAHELRHCDNTALRMIALELDIDKGAR